MIRTEKQHGLSAIIFILTLSVAGSSVQSHDERSAPAAVAPVAPVWAQATTTSKTSVNPIPKPTPQVTSTIATGTNADRIYGKITTTDGKSYEGFMRWDKNETHWFDLLNGTKRLDRRQLREIERMAEKESRRYEHDDNWGNWAVSMNTSAESGVRFGNISKIEAVGDDEALLTMKDGETVRFMGGSTDIGSDMRELLIEDINEGEVELTWDDLETVELKAAPANAPCRWGQRLYGTVTTRRGQQLTGQITWDMDEVFTDDVLDGEDRDRTRKFRFDRISKIARYSSNASVVTLKNGEEVTLRGTNDVDDSNRGVVVSDPTVGDQRIEWSDLETLEFKDPQPGPSYSSFVPPHKLHGTVTTSDGGSFTGEIRWDNDETSSWELLNGNTRDVTYDVEFSMISSIERRARRAVVVTLRSGKTLELRGSNDVDEDNKGIVIHTASGKDEVVFWEDFDKVVFDK